MKYGFLKVAAVTPKIKVADPGHNSKVIIEKIKELSEKRVKLMVFPELCITGYTCADLFLQELLLEEAKDALEAIVKATCDVDALIFVGLPIEKECSLYNVAAVINHGRLLGFVPKYHIPSYGEFSETRYFAEGNIKPCEYRFISKGMDVTVPFGTNIVYTSDAISGLGVACEICEDIWAADTPSTAHAAAGATVVVNLSASNEIVGKDEYREMLVKSTSARLLSGYIFTSCGEGESTQDLVFGGHKLIGENGTILAQKKCFVSDTLVTDLDIHRICMERRKINTFVPGQSEDYVKVPFELKEEDVVLDRTFAKMPFVPDDEGIRDKRCNEILSIQSYGLKKRFEHIGCQKAIIGVSGGLDSTLALLVVARTFDLLNIPRENIMAVTMPCFGTTDRTYDNACRLAERLGATLEEINIKEAVTVHFKDIKHPMDKHDVTYENSQARERTQILMDISNRENGLVVGTGDLSELALGWATYNGDHMSMYGVNAGVPKTLLRHLVKYYALTSSDEELKKGGLKGISKKVTNTKKIAEELGIGEPTLIDIISELEKPGRDPREEMPKPILKSDVLEMKDLKEGMELKGTVRNVIDFGAFIDIGVHQDGLVHISKMSDKFIKHPLEVVSVGDVVDVTVLAVDLEKKRIQLSMI